MLIGFTCARCNQRTHRTFSKDAYTKGIVLIQCGGCENRHIIADNLGWFDQPGKIKNIEDMLAQRGEPAPRNTWSKDEEGSILEILAGNDKENQGD